MTSALRRTVTRIVLPMFLVLGVTAQCTEVVFDPSTLQLQKGTQDATQVSVIINEFPQEQKLGTASFYLKWDKATDDSLELINFQWNADFLPNTGATNPNHADGLDVSSGADTNITPENLPAVADGTVILTFDVKPTAGALGEVDLTFNASDEIYNFLVNPRNQDIEANWGTCTVDIVEEPDPARLNNVSPAAGRQKDPVAVNLGWQEGNADTFELQYREDGGDWTDVEQSAIEPDIGNKSLEWTSGFTIKTVHVRARALHVEKVWNPEAGEAVDADGTPEVGWVAAQDPVTVDNQPPNFVDASGTKASDKVTLRAAGNEQLSEESAGDTNKYSIEDKGLEEAQADNGITVEQASFDPATPNEIILTVSKQLQGKHRYGVTIAGSVKDSVGNTSGSPQTVDFVVPLNPVLEKATFVKKDKVRVKFDQDMNSETLRDGWSLEPENDSQDKQFGVSFFNELEDKQEEFDLKIEPDMDPGARYLIEAPASAKSAAEPPLQILEEDREEDFQSKRWHTFGDGVRMVGIPLKLQGEDVQDLFDAEDVAKYTGSTDNPYTFSSDPDTSIEFENGRGYFAKFDGDTTAYLPPGPAELEPGDSVSVQEGWDIISPPSDTGLAELSLDGSNGSDIDFAWYYETEQWYLIANVDGDALNRRVLDKLERWKGYFIKSNAGRVTMGTGESAAGAAHSPRALALDEDVTTIQLVAAAGGATDEMNLCGVGNQEIQIANPPAVDGSVDLCFVDDAGHRAAIDVSSGSICQSWDVVVSTSLAETAVTVSAPDLSDVPNEYAVILKDSASGDTCYLRTSNGYSFETGTDGCSRNLTLKIVEKAETALLGGVTAQAVNGNHAVITYSLNGAAAVSAEVRNIAGRPVRRIVSDRAQTAGTHNLTWNLASAEGTKVPNGRYLVVLNARTEDGQQVQAVRSLSINR